MGETSIEFPIQVLLFYSGKNTEMELGICISRDNLWMVRHIQHIPFFVRKKGKKHWRSFYKNGYGRIRVKVNSMTEQILWWKGSFFSPSIFPNKGDCGPMSMCAGFITTGASWEGRHIKSTLRPNHFGAIQKFHTGTHHSLGFDGKWYYFHHRMHTWEDSHVLSDPAMSCWDLYPKSAGLTTRSGTLGRKVFAPAFLVLPIYLTPLLRRGIAINLFTFLLV